MRGDAIAQIASVTTLAKRKIVLHQWIRTIEELAVRSAKFAHALGEVRKHIGLAETAVSSPASLTAQD